VPRVRRVAAQKRLVAVTKVCALCALTVTVRGLSAWVDYSAPTVFGASPIVS
jgi:hypothetical protein